MQQEILEPGLDWRRDCASFSSWFSSWM